MHAGQTFRTCASAPPGLTLVSVFALLTLATDGLATPRIHFDQSEYRISNNQPLEMQILIDGEPRTIPDDAIPSGLFSYGVQVQVDAVNAELDTAAQVPAELDFFGFDAGASREQIRPGVIAIRGNVNRRANPIENYDGSLLATVSLLNLAPALSEYKVSLSLFRTLGPTQQVFLDGKGNVLDSTITFESAVVRIDSLPGDTDGDGMLTAVDIDLICQHIAAGGADRRFDLNGDNQVSISDVDFWVERIKQTYIGDSNLDGEFNSGDFVNVFRIGEYEDRLTENSTWADGDWNCDGEFDSGDFVRAFRAGGFEMGPRKLDAEVVPEACGLALLLSGLPVLMLRHRACRTSPRATCP